MRMNQYDCEDTDSFKSNICGGVLPFVSKIHYNVRGVGGWGGECIKAFQQHMPVMGCNS